MSTDRRPRRILHLDVDAFLASVEQAVHPELRGRPVIVGGMPDSRNLVMSCSYDARACGVRPGMRSSEAARRCPQAVFRRGDSQAANRLRERVAKLLYGFTPRVEISSIDDFFVDLTGGERLHGSARQTAEHIRARVWEETHLPLSIGVSTNKTMARLAGKLAKPGGVAEILPGYERAFLHGLPVGQLPGVGHSTSRLLERFAIRTAGELALVSREVLFASFGSLGLVLHERARGIDDAPIEASFRLNGGSAGSGGTLWLKAPRSIQRDSTFEPEEGRRAVVEAMLAYVVERAAHKLRAHKLKAGSVEVRLVYVDTRPPSLRRITASESGLVSKRRAPSRATDSTDELIDHARRLLRELPQRRALVKRVGVCLRELRTTRAWQHSLFSDPLHSRSQEGEELRLETDASDEAGRFEASRADRQRRLDDALDTLRERHGFGRVLRGSSARLLEPRVRDERGGENTPAFPLERDGFRLRTPSLNQ